MFSGVTGGTWTFVDEATKTSTTKVVGQDSSPSKVKAAFDAAKATLSPSSDSTLVGYDPRGNKFRYTGVTMGKKFNR